MLVRVDRVLGTHVIRVPAAILGDLENPGRIEAVDLEAALLIHGLKPRPREAWASSLQTLHDRGEDRLFLD